MTDESLPDARCCILFERNHIYRHGVSVRSYLTGFNVGMYGGRTRDSNLPQNEIFTVDAAAAARQIWAFLKIISIQEQGIDVIFKKDDPMVLHPSVNIASIFSRMSDGCVDNAHRDWFLEFTKLLLENLSDVRLI